MFINITTSETGDNKGSSGALVNYLEKENQMQIEKGKCLEQENWFNGTGNEIRRQEVRMKIDGNIAKLGRSDSKFFLINISPSQKELAFLYEKYGKEDTKEKLKEFAIKVMDEYAKNFKRPGINTHKDLLWYGKHENFRYYKHKDKEVRTVQEKQVSAKMEDRIIFRSSSAVRILRTGLSLVHKIHQRVKIKSIQPNLASLTVPPLNNQARICLMLCLILRGD